MVDESRGEGMIREDEYDRLAGALGFTERTVTDVLLPRHQLVTVPQGATGADIEEVCAETGYSRFPVASHGRRAARLPAHQGRARRPIPSAGCARSRTSGSAPSPPCAPATCCTTRSPRSSPAVPTWVASSATTVRSSGSSPSRTSSRSWSARSATPPTAPPSSCNAGLWTLNTRCASWDASTARGESRRRVRLRVRAPGRRSRRRRPGRRARRGPVAAAGRTRRAWGCRRRRGARARSRARAPAETAGRGGRRGRR